MTRTNIADTTMRIGAQMDQRINAAVSMLRLPGSTPRADDVPHNDESPHSDDTLFTSALS